MVQLELKSPLLLKAVWAVLGIWIGVAFAMTTVGVSLVGLVVGFLLAGLVGFVGFRVSERFAVAY